MERARPFVKPTHRLTATVHFADDRENRPQTDRDQPILIFEISSILDHFN